MNLTLLAVSRGFLNVCHIIIIIPRLLFFSPPRTLGHKTSFFHPNAPFPLFLVIRTNISDLIQTAMLKCSYVCVVNFTACRIKLALQSSRLLSTIMFDDIPCSSRYASLNSVSTKNKEISSGTTTNDELIWYRNANVASEHKFHFSA